jgi:UDPglucose 6-dehydrogenase
MRITMIGTGYVGLVTGAGLAEMGARVTCADIDAGKIARLERGEIPIHEPGLDVMVARNVKAGRLDFTADVPAAIAAADVVFVAVGTPPRIDGAADLSALDAVAADVAAHATRELVLVVKSTVPVGTNLRVRRIVEGSAHRIHVASNPEFLKEGAAIDDFLKPDRIVVGCDADDAFARRTMERIYHPFMMQKHRVIWMDPASAELTKYVANTMLAMRISFMNEVAGLCEHVGADVHMVRAGIGSDDRIGPRFLYAGPGYGGSCFPKDVTALVAVGEEHGVQLELAAATDRVNRRQKGVLAKKIRRAFGGDVRGRTIALWGLAFKPDTDDIRESPALTLIDILVSEGARVVAHDPEAMPNVRAQYGDRVVLAADAYAAVDGADALVLLTEWRSYRNPDFGEIKRRMAQPWLFDGRNVWSEYGLREQGFTYEGIGVRGS